MPTQRFTYASELGWANGEAPSDEVGAVSTFDPATEGVDIFRYPGELAAGMDRTEIGGATVTDNIVNMKLTSIYNGTVISREVICYGSAGRLYRITDEATPTVTLIGTISNYRDGLEIHKDYAYYAQSTQIGRYGVLNLVTPTATDNYLSGLTSTVKGQNITHPLFSWEGNLYVGDANKLKYVIGSESATTTGTTLLTLDSDLIITAINAAGSLLLFGVGMEPVVDTESKVPAWLMMWDKNDPEDTPSVTEKIPFPEPYIHNIQVVDGQVFVFGIKHLYALVGSTFQIVTRLDSRIAMHGADIHKGQLFFKGSDDIRAIGTPDPQLPSARYRPYSGSGTSVTALKWVQDGKLWVADNNNLYEYKTGSQTGVTWKSRRISLAQEHELEEIRIYLAANLASGDDLRVIIYDETSGTTYNAVTFDFATYGAINTLVLHAHQFTAGTPHLTSFQVGIKFHAGAVRVREVAIKHKPVGQK